MSDDNYRKPSSPRATRVGLGLSGAGSSYEQDTLSGRAAPGRARSRHDSDDHYMDPPSETHGTVRDELVDRLRSETDARATAANRTSGQGLFGATLRAHAAQDRVGGELGARRHNAREELDPADMGRVGLFEGALDHTVRAQPLAANATATTRTPAAAAGGRTAPEAWRDEVRRMVERAPSNRPGPAAPNAPGPQQPSGFGGPTAPGGAGGPGIPGSHKPSLRLKLDGDVLEEVPYRTPKSRGPKLLLWLVFLGLIGAGLAYFTAVQGGVTALVKRFSAIQPAHSTQDAQPPAAAPSADLNAQQQQPTAATPAQTQPATPATQQPPAAAANPAQPSAPASASPQPAAKPQPASKPAEPTTPPPAAAKPKAEQPKAAEPAPKPAAAPKAAEPAPKPAAATKQAKPVRPQQPVVKVRPIESKPSIEETAPPAPDHPEIPYVPMPGDPPAPEEAR